MSKIKYIHGKNISLFSEIFTVNKDFEIKKIFILDISHFRDDYILIKTNSSKIEFCIFKFDSFKGKGYYSMSCLNEDYNPNVVFCDYRAAVNAKVNAIKESLNNKRDLITKKTEEISTLSNETLELITLLDETIREYTNLLK